MFGILTPNLSLKWNLFVCVCVCVCVCERACMYWCVYIQQVIILFMLYFCTGAKHEYYPLSR